MENQNTMPNEPQNDIYELLRKVVETNEENIKSTKQTESVHLEARNFYQSAQNAIIGSTNMMQKAMQLVRTELESIIGFKSSIPESIPAHLSETTLSFFERIEKLLLKLVYYEGIGITNKWKILKFAQENKGQPLTLETVLKRIHPIKNLGINGFVKFNAV